MPYTTLINSNCSCTTSEVSCNLSVVRPQHSRLIFAHNFSSDILNNPHLCVLVGLTRCQKKKKKKASKYAGVIELHAFSMNEIEIINERCMCARFLGSSRNDAVR